MSCLALTCLVLPCDLLPCTCLVLPCDLLPCHFVSCLALAYLVLSCLALPCLVMSWHVLSYHILSCFVLRHIYKTRNTQEFGVVVRGGVNGTSHLEVFETQKRSKPLSNSHVPSTGRVREGTVKVLACNMGTERGVEGTLREHFWRFVVRPLIFTRGILPEIRDFLGV